MTFKVTTHDNWKKYTSSQAFVVVVVKLGYQYA